MTVSFVARVVVLIASAALPSGVCRSARERESRHVGRVLGPKGMVIDEVLTDNAKNFTSNAFADALAPRAIKHRWIKPYRPKPTARSIERFNRTIPDEFLYAHHACTTSVAPTTRSARR